MQKKTDDVEYYYYYVDNKNKEQSDLEQQYYNSEKKKDTAKYKMRKQYKCCQISNFRTISGLSKLPMYREKSSHPV